MDTAEAIWETFYKLEIEPGEFGKWEEDNPGKARVYAWVAAHLMKG